MGQEVRLELPEFHPKQLFAFNSLATEILYGGATRGGKSHFTRIALICWCLEIPGLQCDIFRLAFDDVIANHMQGMWSFPVLLSSLEKERLVKINQTEIEFWHGSRISLEHCQDDRVLSKHQGVEKHVRVFEEATQIKERHIRWLRAWVTMSKEMLERVPEKWKGRFPRIIYTSNPIGISAGYFRREFVNARPKESIEKAPASEGGFLRQYIPAKVEDNPSEDAERTRQRVSGIDDEATADALLNENWDAPVGDFIREFNRSIHCVPDFLPPSHWTKFRAFDWGSSDPAYVLWFCISDGEPFKDHMGRERWFKRGCLIVYREWNVCNPNKPSEGLGLTNKEICEGILARTSEMTTGLTLTDSLPFQTRGSGELMAEEFFRHGVPLTRGNTDRHIGWKRVKDLLRGIDNVPMLQICEGCPWLLDYIPALQRHKTDPEDAVDSGEATHACDTLRLGCMTRPVIGDKRVLTNEDMRQAWRQKPTMKDVMKGRGGFSF